jgi:hypothetical protein
MEWCIPVQTFQVEHVQLGTLTRGPKPILPLAYKDSDFQFPSLSILLPTLVVKFYDTVTGRLVLSLGESQALGKLQTFQDMVLNAVQLNYRSWFPSAHKRVQDIRQGFQPILSNQELHLYCPLHESLAQTVPIFQKGAWVQERRKAGYLKAGQRVRIAVRLYGISFHVAPNGSEWSGKFRLQHKLVGILAH